MRYIFQVQILFEMGLDDRYKDHRRGEAKSWQKTGEKKHHAASMYPLKSYFACIVRYNSADEQSLCMKGPN